VLKLTQLRHARKRPHDDLSSREVQKATGFVEHGVALLLQQRGALQAAVEGCAALHARLELLSAVVCGSDAAPEREGDDGQRPEESGGAAESVVLVPQAALAGRRRLAAATQQQLVQHCFECGVLYKQLAVVVPPAQAAELNVVASVIERAARELQAHALPHQDPTLLGICHRLQAERLGSLAAGLSADVQAAAARLLEDQRELAAPLVAELTRAAAVLGQGEGSSSSPVQPDASQDTSAPVTRSRAAEALAGVASAVEEAVVHVLLAVQGLRHPAAAAPPVDESEADDSQHSAMDDHQSVLKLLRAARASELDARLGGVLTALRLLADSGPSAAQRRAAGRLAEQVLPLLRLHLASARWALHQALGYHASFVRLELVLLGTFSELFAKGFCTAQLEEGEGGGGEGGGLDDDVEGTGMGEGEGKQDVSDQLKEEGQLEGGGAEPQEEAAGGESRPQGPDKEEERAKEDEGVEMTNDFDGEMADVEQPEGEEEEQEGAEEPEHGMGDLDEQNQEVVDERLWDKDEDEQLQPQDDDKVEKDAEVEAGDDVTMEAKAEEAEDKPKKKQKKEQDEGKADEAAQPEACEEEPEAPEKEEQAEGGVKPETEFEENNHMDLQPHKEDEADGADEMPEDAPEQMDEGMSDGGEEVDAGDADPPGPEERAEPAEPPAAEEEEGETGQVPAIDSDAEADEEDGKAAESAPPPDADAEPPGDAAEDGEEEATGTERRQYDEQQVFEDAGGRSAAGEPQDGEAQQDDRPEPPDASLNASRAAAQPNSGESDGGDLMQMPRGGRDELEQPRSQRSRPQPNPYHALGDVLQAFHQQLRLVQREPPPADEAGAEPPTARGEETEPDDAPPANADFELVGTGQAFDTQVLADATHEQLEQGDAAEPPPDEAEATAEAMQEEEPAEPMEEENIPDLAAEMRELEPDQKQSSKRRGRQAAPDEPIVEAAAERDEASEEPWAVERDAAEGPDGAGLIGPSDGSLLLAAEEREEAAQPEVSVERDPGVLEEMHVELMREIAAWQLDVARVTSSEELWRRFEALTAPLAQELCEQLRLILEATVASKMQGDYRTGKRISMRKVIPYIASGYRKDKIWLRRTKPAKRQYQVMLCVDDSESMRSTGAGGLACEALALICGALSRLEVGQLAVASFAEQVRLLHPFDRPFSAEAGAHMMSRFTFAKQETDMEGLLRTVVQTLRLAREQQRGSATEQMQLCVIVSDGRRSPAWGDPSLWVRRAAEEKILLCFVIIDAAANKDSILELQSVTYPNGKLTISKWIDAFPFPYYIVLKELRALPQVLSDALRQWFELMR
jgi:midasin